MELNFDKMEPNLDKMELSLDKMELSFDMPGYCMYYELYVCILFYPL